MRRKGRLTVMSKAKYPAFGVLDLNSDKIVALATSKHEAMSFAKYNAAKKGGSVVVQVIGAVRRS